VIIVCWWYIQLRWRNQAFHKKCTLLYFVVFSYWGDLDRILATTFFILYTFYWLFMWLIVSLSTPIKMLPYHWQLPFCRAVLISCKWQLTYVCNMVTDGMSQREIKQSVMSRLWGGLPSLIRFHCYTACLSCSVLSLLRLFLTVIIYSCAAFVICNKARGLWFVYTAYKPHEPVA